MAKLKINKSNTTQKNFKDSWKILIVDDEIEVHKVTKAVLSDVVIEGKNLEFISAYSKAEAYDILKEIKDIVVVFLDVVMETDDAGLQLVKDIREEMHNDLIRIVLRTGQPGCAPESRIKM